MTSAATPSKQSTPAVPEARALIAALEHVLGKADAPLALHEPLFAGNESAYTQACIAEGWVSYMGRFVDQFEKELAQTTGAPFALAVVNGTCALQMALLAEGVEAGDEVLMPSLTFVATANAASHLGAVPHFVDVEETSLGIDPKRLQTYLEKNTRRENGVTYNSKTGRKISALVPVHVFGHPCQTDALAAVAEVFNLAFVVDATEALGSTESGQGIGAKYTGVLSFNGNKIITTGGGGAVLLRDEAAYTRLKHLTTTAKKPHAFAFEHDAVGWNHRLPNINAALGCAQLEQLPKFVSAKRALAARYQAAFSAIPGVCFFQEPANTQSNYWLNAIIVEQGTNEWLEHTLSALQTAKFLCRPVWKPLHELPMYTACPRDDLRVTESLKNRIINLPSSVKLGLPHV